MLLKSGTGWLAGPFDVVSIIKNVRTGKFHVYFVCERSIPGQGGKNPSDMPGFALRSQLVDEQGTDTYEAAVEELTKLREKLSISDENVWSKPEQVLERDCSEGFVTTLFALPWKGRPETPKLLLQPPPELQRLLDQMLTESVDLLRKYFPRDRPGADRN